jgi:hypothetical protein
MTAPIIQGTHDREQERPAYRFGMWFLTLGDSVTGIHRIRRIAVEGTLIALCGCLCISTDEGIFPLQRIAIHDVARPTVPVY